MTDKTKKAVSGDLLNTQEAAEHLGVRRKQLENYRGHKRGPKYIKIGHICFYNISDLDEWQQLEESKRKSKKLRYASNSVGNKRVKIKAVKLDKRFNVDDVQLNINQMEALIDSKKGFLVNKTDVALFKSVMLTLISLNKKIEAL